PLGSPSVSGKGTTRVDLGPWGNTSRRVWSAVAWLVSGSSSNLPRDPAPTPDSPLGAIQKVSGGLSGSPPRCADTPSTTSGPTGSGAWTSTPPSPSATRAHFETPYAHFATLRASPIPCTSANPCAKDSAKARKLSFTNAAASWGARSEGLSTEA